MKKIIFVILFAIISLGIDAQGYSCDKVAFTNFLVRMTTMPHSTVYVQ